MKTDQAEIQRLNAVAADGTEALLGALVERYGRAVKLASSLGAEDQVLSHMLLAIDPRASIFVLDTGRLHQETYDLMARMMSRYRMHYQVLFPQSAAVQEMVRDAGPNLFYASVDGRKRCCGIRKVEPLGRALGAAAAWVTGLRRAQSSERADTPFVEWDAAHDALKANPLADWTDDQVWHYLRAHDVPYNLLHDRGFVSIGCAPCTRAIEPGEDSRAGRWWWEQDTAKECGLHPDRRAAASGDSPSSERATTKKTPAPSRPAAAP